VELAQNAEKIRAAGLGLAAISYDSPAVLKNFSDRQKIGFPLLSDPGSKTIREYGILNEEAPKDSFAYGVPYPGIYILDARGVVTAKYFEADYKERDSTGLILLKQFGIEPETAHASQRAKHLTIITSSTAPVLRPSLKLELTAEIAMDPHVHVYAPGVEGYAPVSWTMTPSAAWKSSEVHFPASKTLNLEAIHETVPVFDGKFRLSRELIIADDKTVRPLLDVSGNLVIEGVIKYQACDDRQCFLPASVPVKWTVPFQALDRTRVPTELQRKP
jgi:hypothetical protein